MSISLEIIIDSNPNKLMSYICMPNIAENDKLDKILERCKFWANDTAQGFVHKHNIMLKQWTTMDIIFSSNKNKIELKLYKSTIIEESINNYPDPFQFIESIFFKEFNNKLKELDKRKLCILLAK
jgi:hypothetical protein